MVKNETVLIGGLERETVTVERSPTSQGTSYLELLFELFGNCVKPIVCCFIAPQTRVGAASFCRQVAFKLAGSDKQSKHSVALLKGSVLLAGQSVETLQPIPSLTRGENLTIWGWASSDDSESELQVAAPLALHETLQALRSQFDYILIDCPPVSSSGLAVALAALADKVILLVHQGDVSRGEVQAAQRALMLHGAPLVGCVLFRDGYTDERLVDGRTKQ